MPDLGFEVEAWTDFRIEIGQNQLDKGCKILGSFWLRDFGVPSGVLLGIKT